MRLHIFLMSLWVLLQAGPVGADLASSGIRYWTQTTSQEQHIHVVEIDPQKMKIIAVSAEEVGRRRESVGFLAHLHEAVVGINGGFFRLDSQGNGLPAGVLKLNDHWHGIAYKKRAAIGWSSDTGKDALINRVTTKTHVKINQHFWTVHLMDHRSHPAKAVLYTPNYGINTDVTGQSTQVVVKEGRVAAILDKPGVAIPEKGFVYAIGNQLKWSLHRIHLQDPASIEIELIPQFQPRQAEKWQKFQYVVGGSPLLIHRGRLVQDHAAEQLPKRFVYERHARTAIGLLPNHHWVFVVVDQNQLLGRYGMTIPELSKFLMQLGCEYALNMDGGSSSTLYLDHQVVNQNETAEDDGLSFMAVRKVSDAILVLPKK